MEWVTYMNRIDCHTSPQKKCQEFFSKKLFFFGQKILDTWNQGKPYGFLVLSMFLMIGITRAAAHPSIFRSKVESAWATIECSSMSPCLTGILVSTHTVARGYRSASLVAIDMAC